MNELQESITTEQHQAGFRLQYLEVFNWGTFNKVRWQIQPNGHNALLTGDIGSGKSTLVDALTCLLVPHNKIVFNKAAGAEGKERNLLSYVKGEYKKEKEEITKIAKKIYIRPNDDTYTVIIGNFYNEGYDENICLAQLFWIGKEGKVEKLLIIGKQPLTIKEHFQQFTDINDLRKKLRHTEGVQLFNDNFTQYSEQFRRLFGMNSEKAIDLFYQTVSMKSVSSLTDFVREQMLERSDVKDSISSLLKRFDDLQTAHTAVMKAREQHEILKPLMEGCIEYSNVSKETESIETMLNITPAWFAERKIDLLKETIHGTQQELENNIRLQNQWTDEKNILEDKRTSILLDIDHNGGKRIEQIGTEIKRHEQDKENKEKEFNDYDRLAKKCGLNGVSNENEFHHNIHQSNEKYATCMLQEEELRTQRDRIVSNLRKQETDYQVEEQELNSLKDRKTQIPSWLIGFRSQLCSDLRISEEELPFLGELLKVKEKESDWEGAIERLLHDAGISLLVSNAHYSSVSQYVNDNMLRSPDGRGIKLTYLEANLGNVGKNNKQTEQESVTHKIDIKSDTQFYEWLEEYLQRSFGDYLCVDINKLQQVPFGITKQGLRKSGRIRHTKDDRQKLGDRRNYVLGWSNTEKISLLESNLDKLNKEITILSHEKTEVEKQQEQNNQLKQLLSILSNQKDFSRIHWQYHAEQIEALEKERHELLTHNDTLALLQNKKVEVEQLLNELQVKERNTTENIGRLKSDAGKFKEQQEEAYLLLQEFPEHQKSNWFPIIQEKISGITITLRSIDNCQKDFIKQYQGENGELKKLRYRLSNLRSSIEKKMQEIKEHSRAEYSEITATIDARAEYLQKFEKLISEDLKRHEERFKEELNKNTINGIAVFDNQLEKYEKDIKQKITTINRHLSEIVYNSVKDTFITLQMDITPNKEVRLFKEDLKKCYTHSFSSNTELYTEEKYEQVKKILDRFASGENSDREWTNTVTDVRQWFEFNASERYRADDSEKEFYEGSGGKSGGQKEKLAYTILASALAYQFGLQFGESKSRSFRFVVIDEAFGRGSDESTRYGLELFRKLNLQLLIVTPLQKIHVIEGHVNSFHFVSNREGNNSQVSNFTKEEYEKEKIKHLNLLQDNSNQV